MVMNIYIYLCVILGITGIFFSELKTMIQEADDSVPDLTARPGVRIKHFCYFNNYAVYTHTKVLFYNTWELPMQRWIIYQYPPIPYRCVLSF